MNRPTFESSYAYLLIGLTSYIVADLITLGYRDSFLPTQAPPEQSIHPQNYIPISQSSFNDIIRKNIFSMDGKVPVALGAGDPSDDKSEDEDQDPVPTQIPGLQIIGTLVHTNPAKSVASLKTSTSGEIVGAFRVGQVIDGVGEVLEIQRGRIIFRNIVSRRKEFIEITQDSKINLGILTDKATPLASEKKEGAVTVVSEYERKVNRADVTRLTSNITDILRQASTVAVSNGFQIVDILPGSIFEQLGLKKGDIITSVNGESITSQEKAMEKYNELRNSDKIALGIERNGINETINYTVQ